MVQDVLWSNGRAHHYEYSGSLMTAIVDEKGRILLRNSYQGTLLVKQEFPNDQRYAYEYQWSASGRYVDSAEILLPNGGHQTVRVGDSVPNVVRNMKK
jgi:hypothetical protein